jgi:hypothetical protein
MQSRPQKGLAFRANVEIVTVPFTVVDANGAAVGNLTRGNSACMLMVSRQKVLKRPWDNDLPLTVGVIIDS